MKIEKGQKAPDFSLYSSDKSKITLSELKGQNILFGPQARLGYEHLAQREQQLAYRRGLQFAIQSSQGLMSPLVRFL